MTTRLISDLARLDEHLFSGFVLDPLRLDQRFVVDIRLDGMPVMVCRADRFEPGLRSRWQGDGRHAFFVELSKDQAAAAERLDAVIANSDIAVGLPIDFRHTPYSPGPMPAGTVALTADGRIEGRAPRQPQLEGDVTLRLVQDGEIVSKTRLRRFQPAARQSETPFLVPFSLDPVQLGVRKDGGPVHVRDGRDRDLEGSPLLLDAPAASERPAAAKSDALRIQVIVFGAIHPDVETMRAEADWSLVQCPLDEDGKAALRTFEEALGVNGGIEEIVLLLGAETRLAEGALDLVQLRLTEQSEIIGIETVLPASTPRRTLTALPAEFLACRRSSVAPLSAVEPLPVEEIIAAIRSQHDDGRFLTLPGLCVG
jgi:hypothetical protein